MLGIIRMAIVRTGEAIAGGTNAIARSREAIASTLLSCLLCRDPNVLRRASAVFCMRRNTWEPL